MSSFVVFAFKNQMLQTILEITATTEHLLLILGVLLVLALVINQIDRRPYSFCSLVGTLRTTKNKNTRRYAYNKLISTSGRVNLRHVSYVSRSRNVSRAVFKSCSTTFRVRDKLVTINCPVFLGKEEADAAIRDFARHASFADMRQLAKNTYHVNPSSNMRNFILTLLRDHDRKPQLSMSILGTPFVEETLKFALNFLLSRVGIYPRAGIHFGMFEFLHTYPRFGLIRIFPMLMHFVLATLPYDLRGYIISIVLHSLWNYYAYRFQGAFTFRTDENMLAATRVRNERFDSRYAYFGIIPFVAAIIFDYGIIGAWAIVGWIVPVAEEVAKQAGTNIGVAFPGIWFGFLEMIMYMRDGVAFIVRLPALIMHSLTDVLTFKDSVILHRVFNTLAFLPAFLPIWTFYVTAYSWMSIFAYLRYSEDHYRANLYRLERTFLFLKGGYNFDKFIDACYYSDKRAWFSLFVEEWAYNEAGFLVFLFEFLVKKYIHETKPKGEYYFFFCYYRLMMWAIFPIYISIPLNALGHLLWNHNKPRDTFSVADLIKQSSIGDVTSLMNMIKTLYDRFVNKQWAAMMLWFADVGLNHINFAFPAELGESLKGITLLSDNAEPLVGHFFARITDTSFFQSLKKLFTTLLSVKLFGTDGIARDFVDRFRERFFGKEETTWNAFVSTTITITSQLSKFASTWDINVLLERPLASEVRLVQTHLRNNPYSTLSAKENQAALTAASNVMARMDAKPGALTPEEMVAKKLIAEDMEHRLNFLSNDTTREPAFPFVLLGSPGVGKTTIMHDAFNLCSKVAGVEFNAPAVVELQWQQTFPAEARPKGSAHALVYNDGPGDYSNFTEKGLLAFDVIAQTAIDSCALVLPSASLEKKAELHNELKFLFFTSNHYSFKFENNAKRLERRLNGGIVASLAIVKDGEVVPNQEFVNWSQEEQWAHTVFTFGTMQAENNRMKFVPSEVQLTGSDGISYMAQRYKIFVDRARERKIKEDEKCDCGMTIKRHMSYIDGELRYKPLTDMCAPMKEPQLRPHNVFTRVSEAVKQALNQNPRLDSGYQATEKRLFTLEKGVVNLLSDSLEEVEEKAAEPDDVGFLNISQAPTTEESEDREQYHPENNPLPEVVPPVPLPGMTEGGTEVYQNAYLSVQEKSSRLGMSFESSQVYHNVAIMFVSKWFWTFTATSYLLCAIIGHYVNAVPLYFHLFFVLAMISYQGPVVAQIIAGDDKEEAIDRLAESNLVPEPVLKLALFIYLRKKTNTLRDKIDKNSSILLALAATGVLTAAFYQWIVSEDVKVSKEPVLPKKKERAAEAMGVLDYDEIVFESDRCDDLPDALKSEQDILDRIKRAKITLGNVQAPTFDNTDLDTMEHYEDLPDVVYPKQEKNRVQWQRSIPSVKVSDVGTTLSTMPQRVSRNTRKMIVSTVYSDNTMTIETVHFTWLNNLVAVTVAHAFKSFDDLSNVSHYVVMFMDDDERYTTYRVMDWGKGRAIPDIRLFGEAAIVLMPNHKQCNDLCKHLIDFEEPFECTVHWERRESSTLVGPMRVGKHKVFASKTGISDISGTAGDCGRVCWAKVSTGIAIVGVFFGRVSDKHILFYPLTKKIVTRLVGVSVTQHAIMLEKVRKWITFGDVPDNSLVVTRESKYVELIGTSPCTNTFSSSICDTPVKEYFVNRLETKLSKPYCVKALKDNEFHSSWRHSTAQLDMNNDSSSYERAANMLRCWTYFHKANGSRVYKIRPLRLSEAFFGCDAMDIERITFNTSLGFVKFPETSMIYRHQGLRDKYDLFTRDDESSKFKLSKFARQDIEETLKLLREGPINCFVEFTHKDEVRPCSKVDVAKVRLFSVLDFTFNIITRMYILPIIKVCEKEFAFMCASINAASRDWKALYESLEPTNRFQFVYDKDGKAFDMSQDSTCFVGLGIFLSEVAKLIGYSEQDRQIVRNIATSICSKLCVLNGDYFFMTKGLPSGWIATLFCNGMVNISNDLIAASRLGFSDNYFDIFVTRVMGDDYISMIDVMELLTHLKMPLQERKDALVRLRDEPSYARYVATSIIDDMVAIQHKLGFVHTSGLKDGPPGIVELSEAIFLKRSFKVHPDLGEVTGALNKDSIWKALCFQSSKSAITAEERLRDVVLMAQRELFLHSEKDLLDFHKDMDSPQLSMYGWEKLSYEWLKENYLKSELQMTGL